MDERESFAPPSLKHRSLSRQCPACSHRSQCKNSLMICYPWRSLFQFRRICGRRFALLRRNHQARPFPRKANKALIANHSLRYPKNISVDPSYPKRNPLGLHRLLSPNVLTFFLPSLYCQKHAPHLAGRRSPIRLLLLFVF